MMTTRAKGVVDGMVNDGSWADLAPRIEKVRIVYAGVGKTAAEIEYALREGILFFTVESEPEAMQIGETARRAPDAPGGRTAGCRGSPGRLGDVGVKRRRRRPGLVFAHE